MYGLIWYLPYFLLYSEHDTESCLYICLSCLHRRWNKIHWNVLNTKWPTFVTTSDFFGYYVNYESVKCKLHSAYILLKGTRYVGTFRNWSLCKYSEYSATSFMSLWHAHLRSYKKMVEIDSWILEKTVCNEYIKLYYSLVLRMYRMRMKYLIHMFLMNTSLVSVWFNYFFWYVRQTETISS